MAASYLIDAGADVWAKNNDLTTPLHFAAAEGHFEVVQVKFELNLKPYTRTRRAGTSSKGLGFRSRGISRFGRYCMDGWMDGWMDGRMEGWMDG